MGTSYHKIVSELQRRVLQKPVYWYIFYVASILFFDYLVASSYDFYSFLILYLKYPWYLASAFLGGHIPYKLFKKFEHIEPQSELQVWTYNLLSIASAVISIIALVFLLSVLIGFASTTNGKEVGFGITILFGVMFLGMVLLSRYLLFKYKVRSGIILHRGMGW